MGLVFRAVSRLFAPALVADSGLNGDKREVPSMTPERSRPLMTPTTWMCGWPVGGQLVSEYLTLREDSIPSERH